jgi:CRP/FNR family transcriptional regulator, anaerobic regulatory protein
MIDTRAELLRLYPALSDLDDRTFAATVAQAQVVDLPAGTQLFAEGSVCRQFPLVLSGSIRVAKVGEGRELQLYRVGPGESCVLTSSCLVGSRIYPATGVVESDVRLVVLPRTVFEQLMAQHPPFRQYVFGLFAERLTELMGLVEAIAFHRFDRRLAATLLGHGRVIEATHQQLADELGSVREIVTRVLRSFAEQGLVSLGRGSIEVLDATGLRRIAAGE